MKIFISMASLHSFPHSNLFVTEYSNWTNSCYLEGTILKNRIKVSFVNFLNILLELLCSSIFMECCMKSMFPVIHILLSKTWNKFHIFTIIKAWGYVVQAIKNVIKSVNLDKKKCFVMCLWDVNEVPCFVCPAGDKHFSHTGGRGTENIGNSLNITLDLLELCSITMMRSED